MPRATSQELAAWVEQANRLVSATYNDLKFPGTVRVVDPGLPGTVRVEMPVEKAPGGWYLSVLLADREDELVVAELRLYPGSAASRGRRPVGEWNGLDPIPGDGVTTTLMRQLSLPGVIRAGRDAVEAARDGKKYRRVPEKVRVRKVVEQLARAEPPVRSGRAGTPDSYYLTYAKLRAEYRDSRSPVKDMAKALDMKRDVVRDLIQEARRRGLLTPDNRLTDKARALDAEDKRKRKRK